MRTVTFGEVMGRVSAPGFTRFRQALPGHVDVTFAGAEANVAASLAILGAKADFVTALPENALADACVSALRGLGVGVDKIAHRDVGRLGLYFVEAGANQRPSQVIYDREGATVSMMQADAYDWPKILAGAGWFHTTGITPAISREAAGAALTAIDAAKRAGATVSCDLNFRKKLWRWEAGTNPTDLATRTMRTILPFVDVLIANEEDCGDVLGIRADGADVNAGSLNVDRYPEVARAVVAQFPNLSHVAITLRESRSASHNNWGAMLYTTARDEARFAPLSDGQYTPYPIHNIVDRVGAGDSFAAALIYALQTPSLAPSETAVAFAAAASCLAHSIPGDFNFSTRPEIEALMRGSASGRVQR